MRSAAVLLLACALAPVQTPDPSPAPTPAPPTASPEALTPEAMRSRERNVLIAVSTVLLAEKNYAAQNGGFFDEMRCLMKPVECLPALPADAMPFLDPTYDWLEPRLGYTRAFHPGPRPTAEEIENAAASASSVKAFAYTATPLEPGISGTRAFCGDSRGRLCFTPDGREPPVKEGRCDPCKKME